MANARSAARLLLIVAALFGIAACTGTGQPALQTASPGSPSVSMAPGAGGGGGMGGGGGGMGGGGGGGGAGY